MKNCGNNTLPIVFKVALSSLFSFPPIFHAQDLAGHSVDEDEAPGKKKKGGGDSSDLMALCNNSLSREDGFLFLQGAALPADDHPALY